MLEHIVRELPIECFAQKDMLFDVCYMHKNIKPLRQPPSQYNSGGTKKINFLHAAEYKASKSPYPYKWFP